MARAAPRRGFTIVEVVVALLLLCVGGLALAATAAHLALQLRFDGQRSRAVALTRQRTELLVSGRCGTLAGGSERTDGITLEWSAAPAPVMAELSQRASYRGSRGNRSDSYASALLCE